MINILQSLTSSQANDDDNDESMVRIQARWKWHECLQVSRIRVLLVLKIQPFFRSEPSENID